MAFCPNVKALEVRVSNSSEITVLPHKTVVPNSTLKAALHLHSFTFIFTRQTQVLIVDTRLLDQTQ
jgi:hypothetical protein